MRHLSFAEWAGGGVPNRRAGLCLRVLDASLGDAEGGVEMSESMRYVNDFCQLFGRNGHAAATRIFFPDFNELKRAQKEVFDGSPFQLDCLTRPSAFSDLGIGWKVNVAERVEANDAFFVAAYPYFNVNEILAVEELYRGSAQPSGRPVIVFNGELDRIRSGYYPSFFYPKLGKLAKSFLPEFESAFYLHNFKGRCGGKLFRVYPGPWQVLQGDSKSGLTCIHTQDSMPTLRHVALDILQGPQ